MKKPLKLINECDMAEYRLITEAFDPSKPQMLKIEGVYIVADRKNGNDRIYPYEDLKRAVDEFIETKVNTNTALEELEHPTDISINPDRVCARTLSLVEQDKSWIGTSLVLASDEKFGIKGTPCGDILKSLLQFGTTLGHSTRGCGDVDDDGNVSNYHLICIDTVLNPSIGIFNDSNGNRIVNGILESKDFMINNHGELVESTYVDFEKKLDNMPKTSISEKKNRYLAKAICGFLNGIAS